MTCLDQFPRTLKDNNLHEKLNYYNKISYTSKKVSSNKVITDYQESVLLKKPRTKFFTPKSSPKISNHFEPIRL